MSVKRISSRLQKILHSLATRVPKVVLHRAEDIFPTLNTSLVSSLWLFLAKYRVLCFSCRCHETLLHTKPTSVVDFGYVYSL